MLVCRSAYAGGAALPATPGAEAWLPDRGTVRRARMQREIFVFRFYPRYRSAAERVDAVGADGGGAEEADRWQVTAGGGGRSGVFLTEQFPAGIRSDLPDVAVAIPAGEPGGRRAWRLRGSLPDNAITYLISSRVGCWELPPMRLIEFRMSHGCECAFPEDSRWCKLRNTKGLLQIPATLASGDDCK